LLLLRLAKAVFAYESFRKIFKPKYPIKTPMFRSFINSKRTGFDSSIKNYLLVTYQHPLGFVKEDKSPGFLKFNLP
jgi:hypothetical protein